MLKTIRLSILLADNDGSEVLLLTSGGVLTFAKVPRIMKQSHLTQRFVTAVMDQLDLPKVITVTVLNVNDNSPVFTSGDF